MENLKTADRPNILPTILIVGAGPSGLTLAAQLAHRGIIAKIIDSGKGPTPPHESRALAFNLRSLDLLAPCGVAEKLLSHGFEIHKAQFHWNGKKLGTMTIADHQRADAHLLVIPQGTSENILIDHLRGFGIRPNWQNELMETSHLNATPTAKIRSAKGNISTHEFDIIVGCDGAHSTVRKQAKIKFDGEASPTIWGLLDAQYDSNIIEHQLNAFLAPGTARAHIPVAPNKLRIISNRGVRDDDIPFRDQLERVTWRSQFSVSYRLVETFAKGNIFLCGDAAHIHSPVGGRGMNLGIEDACWLAWCIDKNRLDDYNPARMTAAKSVMAQTKIQTKVITGTLPGASFLLKYIAPIMFRIGFVRSRNLNTMLGLDTAPAPWL